MHSVHRPLFNTILKNRIVQEIYFSQSATCSELSEALDRSIPLISKTLYELIEGGYVNEKGYGPSKGGRRPLMYSLKSDSMYVLAISLDQLYLKIGLVDMAQHYAHPIKTIPLILLDNKSSLQTLVSIIEEYLDETRMNRIQIIGIGIGMPGFIDATKGISYTYLLTGTDETLRDYLERQLNIPVHIENDSSMIALAELKFGLAKGKQDVMVINIGWGIGLGMIINGLPFRGFNGYAGELSHIPISESNTLCECGKRGCLETEASLRVVSKIAIEDIRNGKVSNLRATDDPDLMIDYIMQAALRGDQYVIELLSDMGEKIGKAIAILNHIVNPEMVVLSGRGAKVGRILITSMQQALNRYSIPRLAENLELKVSKLGDDVGLISAAALAVQHFGENHETK